MANTHILQKMDVLRSFQIAKFIPDSDLEKIQEEVKSLPKKERDAAFEKRIDAMIGSEKDLDMMPGLITPANQAQRTESLLRQAISIASHIQQRGMTKDEQSFIIVSLVKLLELKLKNFNNWKENQNSDEAKEDQEDDDREEE